MAKVKILIVEVFSIDTDRSSAIVILYIST